MEEKTQNFEKTKKQILKAWTKNKKDASEIAFHFEEIRYSLGKILDDMKTISEDNLISIFTELRFHLPYHQENLIKLLDKEFKNEKSKNHKRTGKNI